MSNASSVNSPLKPSSTPYAAEVKAERKKNATLSPFGTSTLKPSSEKKLYVGAAPSKPVLIPPSSNEKRIVGILERTSALTETHLETQASAIEQHQQKIRELHQEQIEKLKESAQKAQTSASWSILTKVSSYLLSLTTAAAGFALVGTGTALIGGAMLTLGITSLFNLAFIDWGVWDALAKALAGKDETKRQYLATLIPAVIGTMTALLSILYTGGALTGDSSLISMQGIAGILLAFSNITAGVSNIGSGVYQFRNLCIQSELTDLRKNLWTHENLLEEKIGIMRKIMEEYKKLSQQTAQIIKATINTREAVVFQG